jgi:hypothetical protein
VSTSKFQHNQFLFWRRSAELHHLGDQIDSSLLSYSPFLPESTSTAHDPSCLGNYHMETRVREMARLAMINQPPLHQSLLQSAIDVWVLGVLQGASLHLWSSRFGWPAAPLPTKLAILRRQVICVHHALCTLGTLL